MNKETTEIPKFMGPSKSQSFERKFFRRGLLLVTVGIKKQSPYLNTFPQEPVSGNSRHRSDVGRKNQHFHFTGIFPLTVMP
jgi:hypothetical protein